MFKRNPPHKGNRQLTDRGATIYVFVDSEPTPTASELLAAAKWRMRFAIFACLVTLAMLCGALAGWVRP